MYRHSGVPAFLIAVALLSMAPGSAAAQVARDTTHTDSVRVLSPVVTTATRAPVDAGAVARRLDVVHADVLDQVPHADAADVLKKGAGADVIQFGGMLSGIGLRGFRPQYSGISPRTLLLVDGRPAGVTNAALLDLGDAERVEVLHGPASALYGSSAMGGVVNVISRRYTGEAAGRVSAAFGSYGSSDLRVQGGGAIWQAADGRQFDADVSVRRVARTSDYRVGKGNTLRDLVGSEEAIQIVGDEVVGPVDETGDGTRREYTTFGYEAGAMRAGFTAANGIRLDARADLLNAVSIESPGNIFHAGTPFPGNGRKNLRFWSSDVSASGDFGRHAPILRAYYTEEATEYFNTPEGDRFVNFATETFTRGVQLQNAVAVGGGSIVAGVDFVLTDADSWSRSDPTTAAAPFSPNAAHSSMAGFAEWRWRALDGRVIGAVGARADRSTLELKETPLRSDIQAGSESFNVVTPSASLLVGITSTLSARASVGRAFVAPDAVAKAGLITTTGGDGSVAFASGNRDIDAEQSLTVDGGIVIRSASRGLELDLGYFHTRVTDRITAAIGNFDPADRPTTPQGDPVSRVETRINASSATMSGIEARASWDIGRSAGHGWSLRLFANGTHLLDAEERVPVVSVDVNRLPNPTAFEPEQALSALVFGAEVADRIKNVAETTVNAGIEWDDLRRYRARLSARYVGERRDLDFVTFSNDILQPAFMVADISIGARIARRLRADLLVSNVTDENYYEIRGYNLPGREFTVRVSAGF